MTPTRQVVLAWGLGGGRAGWGGTGLEVARGPGQGSVTKNASQELTDVHLREKGEMTAACPQNGAVHTHTCDPQRKRFLPRSPWGPPRRRRRRTDTQASGPQAHVALSTCHQAQGAEPEPSGRPCAGLPMPPPLGDARCLPWLQPLPTKPHAEPGPEGRCPSSRDTKRPADACRRPLSSRVGVLLRLPCPPGSPHASSSGLSSRKPSPLHSLPTASSKALPLGSHPPWK